MKTLEIKVETWQEAEALENELRSSPQVSAVRFRAKKDLKLRSLQQTLTSEASLAESWDSSEDARWNELWR